MDNKHIFIVIFNIILIYYIKFNNGEKQPLLTGLIRLYYFKLFPQINEQL